MGHDRGGSQHHISIASYIHISGCGSLTFGLLSVFLPLKLRRNRIHTRELHHRPLSTVILVQHRSMYMYSSIHL